MEGHGALLSDLQAATLTKGGLQTTRVTLTSVHVTHQLGGGLWGGLARGVQVVQQEDVRGEVQHVLLAAAVRHSDEMTQILCGMKGKSGMKELK